MTAEFERSWRCVLQRQLQVCTEREREREREILQWLLILAHLSPAECSQWERESG